MRKFLPILTFGVLVAVAWMVSPPRPGNALRNSMIGRESKSVPPTSASAAEPSPALTSERSIAFSEETLISHPGRFQTALAFDPAVVFDEPIALEPSIPFEDDIESLGPLAAIVFEGNSTVTTEELFNLVKSRPDQVIDLKQLKNDIRTLVASGKISNVAIRIDRSQEGPVLVIRVTERPLIEKVTFIGNKKFSDERLTHLTHLKAGATYDVDNNRASCHALQYLYHNYGYLNAKVSLDKGDSPDDREIIMKIDEGLKARVTKVIIAGNASVAEAQLQSELTTVEEPAWLSSDKYSNETMDNNVFALTHYYQDLGFFDVQVVHRKSFSDDFSEATIEYVVEEGIRFKIRNFEFVGNDFLSEQQLQEILKIRPGEYYDYRLVDWEKSRIAAQYGELGCVFAKIDAQIRFFEKPGYVDLVYRIEEGRAYSIGPIRKTTNRDDSNPNPPIELASHEIAAAPTATREPARLREIDRLVFMGVKSIALADIRNSLAVDFDMHLATHPNADLLQYMQTLEASILSGYRYGGFPEAIVEIHFNSTRRQVEVHVTEGTRVRCGDVLVSGCKNVPAESLIRSLTDDQRSGRAIWKTGGPAPLEGDTRIRAKIESEFADAGFFHPDFDVTIDGQPETATAVLRVTINSEGPRAVVGKIEVTGTKRDSTEDVLTYLDLRQGAPFDDNSTWKLKRRLSESARYLVHDLSEQATGKMTEDGHEIHDLKIHLREYDKAKPLLQELPPGEQALLKLRDWIKRWSKGETDDDLVVTMSYPSRTAAGDETAAAAIRANANELVKQAKLLLEDDRVDEANVKLQQAEELYVAKTANAPVVAQFDFRMIVAPQRGQTICLTAKPIGGAPLINVVFAAYPDRLVLAAPQRKVKLVLPNSTENRLVFKMKADSASEKSIDRDGKSFSLNVGMGISSIKKPNASPFDVTAESSAAFITSLAHDDDDKMQRLLRDGVWHISNEFLEIQIDAESGRLVLFRLQLEDGMPSLVCRAQNHALPAELQRLDETFAALPVDYDSASPWKSLAEFLADELIFAAGPEADSERANSLRALRKVIGHWSPPGLGQLLDPDGDRSSTDDEPFWIPSHRAAWSYDDLFTPGSPTQKNVTGWLLSVYRRLVPATGWMWPVGRDAALHWVANETPAGLRGAPLSLEIGPGGELCVALLRAYLDVDLSEAAARAGMQRLAKEDFANDYRPLLKGDSWLGQWLLSLAAALRELDEAELQALVRLLPEGAREAIVNSLSLLKNDPDKQVADVLPAVFDRLWSETLRLEVETVFLGWLRTAISNEIRENQVRPASGEEDDFIKRWTKPPAAEEKTDEGKDDEEANEEP